MTTPPVKTDPSLLLEASRVFNAAGGSYRPIAEVLSEAAVASKTANDTVRAAILCDAAALRLSGRVPGGWCRALELLADIKDGTSEDNGMREHLLRALAYGQQYNALKAAHAAEVDLAPVLQNIQASITKAYAAYNANTPQTDPKKPLNIRHYWDMKDPIRQQIPENATDPENDLTAAAYDSPALQQLLANVQAPERRDTK